MFFFSRELDRSHFYPPSNKTKRCVWGAGTVNVKCLAPGGRKCQMSAATKTQMSNVQMFRDRPQNLAEQDHGSQRSQTFFLDPLSQHDGCASWHLTVSSSGVILHMAGTSSTSSFQLWHQHFEDIYMLAPCAAQWHIRLHGVIYG